jgi:hypothetical protein
LYAVLYTLSFQMEVSCLQHVSQFRDKLHYLPNMRFSLEFRIIKIFKKIIYMKYFEDLQDVHCLNGECSIYDDEHLHNMIV